MFGISDYEVRECYKEDTIGRKYHAPIVTKNKPAVVDGECGEVESLQLKKPMQYKEFSELNDELKKIYLTHLRDTYHTTQGRVCEMLGISQSYFWKKVITPLNLYGMYSGVKRKLDEDERAAWNNFLNPAIEEPLEETAEAVEESTVDNTEEVVVSEPTPTATTTRLSFRMCGPLNAVEIARKIATMIEPGTHCTVDVDIRARGDGGYAETF